ncbi:hypothetical protein N781_09895 [Pontibacillus halophilus JSM 076056 = DSM 19796]|uniref:DUF4025 domain-containing protein n=1 Tax=Pontibacillus halophilus JSM 076056 = DSM 19796 TaxID=1385510 RepID=A0A0A5GR30_9BACI|nr:hypothetical protein [Pontibacillus halophilus]KGX93610.1 hypothetical protein N781_09895 [Pontibacillus halophilus JSM 076056 = DSM 19796]
MNEKEKRDEQLYYDDQGDQITAQQLNDSYASGSIDDTVTQHKAK